MYDVPMHAMQLSLRLDDQEDEPPQREPPLFSLAASGVSSKTHRLAVSGEPGATRKLKMSPQSCVFRQQFFPNATDSQWGDWRWQIQNRICSLERVQQMIRLTNEEAKALELAGRVLPMAVTPHYMGLVAADDPDQAIRRAVIPTVYERCHYKGEADDPLGEEHQSPVPGLIHRYPDRVLFLATDFCSTYCRYCTRSRVVGHGSLAPNTQRLQRMFDYIRKDGRVRDVLISGGDPLTLSDARLAFILSNLRAIPHVEIIRIGTKVPAVLPQRITPQLVRVLRKYHPLWMSLHFTHPDECCEETVRACGMLADAGIPLGSQTVLLRGINDTPEIMRKLMHGLMRMRVKPYYLYQCDPITGSQHFRTPVARGLEIIRSLRGHTSGYAVPVYVIDAPGGGGKIPLAPDYVLGKDLEGNILLTNYENGKYQYPDHVVE